MDPTRVPHRVPFPEKRQLCELLERKGNDISTTDGSNCLPGQPLVPLNHALTDFNCWTKNGFRLPCQSLVCLKLPLILPCTQVVMQCYCRRIYGSVCVSRCRCNDDCVPRVAVIVANAQLNSSTYTLPSPIFFHSSAYHSQSKPKPFEISLEPNLLQSNSSKALTALGYHSEPVS